MIVKILTPDTINNLSGSLQIICSGKACHQLEVADLFSDKKLLYTLRHVRRKLKKLVEC
jgi:hypothetical protein